MTFCPYRKYNLIQYTIKNKSLIPNDWNQALMRMKLC